MEGWIKTSSGSLYTHGLQWVKIIDKFQIRIDISMQRCELEKENSVENIRQKLCVRCFFDGIGSSTWFPPELVVSSDEMRHLISEFITYLI